MAKKSTFSLPFKLKINKSYLVIAALALGWGIDHFQDNAQVSGLLKNALSLVDTAKGNIESGAASVLKTEPSTPTTTTKKNSEYQGKVIKVSDGDTIQVVDKNGQKHKIRFAGIDAPESKQSSGQDSQRYLSRLILNQNVTVQVIDVDRYGREVGVMKLKNTDINYEMVKAGWAWHYVAYTKHQSKDVYNQYASAQARAQTKRQGLWQNRSAQAPWKFRQQQRNQAA